MKLRDRHSSDDVSGFLDKGTSVTGELQFSGTLRIDGDFHGSITTNDKLIIGERALVYADIKVGEAEIYGTVSGTITSKKRIEIHSSGRIQGEVSTPVLVVEEGGFLDGSSNMAGGEKSPVPTENPEVSRKEWPGS